MITQVSFYRLLTGIFNRGGPRGAVFFFFSFLLFVPFLPFLFRFFLAFL